MYFFYSLRAFLTSVTVTVLDIERLRARGFERPCIIGPLSIERNLSRCKLELRKMQSKIGGKQIKPVNTSIDVSPWMTPEYPFYRAQKDDL